jgi:hypothetical protein
MAKGNTDYSDLIKDEKEKKPVSYIACAIRNDKVNSSIQRRIVVFEIPSKKNNPLSPIIVNLIKVIVHAHGHGPYT